MPVTDATATALFNILNDPKRQLDRGLNSRSVADVGGERRLRPSAEGGGCDQFATRQSFDVVPIVALEAANLAHGEVECRQQAHVEHVRIQAFE